MSSWTPPKTHFRYTALRWIRLGDLMPKARYLLRDVGPYYVVVYEGQVVGHIDKELERKS